MEQQVQLADGQRSQVALLAVKSKVAYVAALFPHILGRIDEHPAGACCGVADAHSFLRLK